MESIRNLLNKIGCSENESNIFLICLKYGPIGVSKIARILNANRTTAYGYIDKLFQKGILKTVQGSQGNLYIALSSDELIAHLESKQRYRNQLVLESKDMKIDIDLIKNQSTGQKVSYYEGDEVFDKISQRVLNTDTGYYYTNIDAILRLKNWGVEKLITEFRKNSATIKEFIFPSDFQNEYIEGLSSKSHEIKVLPTGSNDNFQSDIGLADGYYYHIAWGSKISAIEIQNPEFYNTQVELFNQLRDKI